MKILRKLYSSHDDAINKEILELSVQDKKDKKELSGILDKKDIVKLKNHHKKELKSDLKRSAAIVGGGTGVFATMAAISAKRSGSKSPAREGLKRAAIAAIPVTAAAIGINAIKQHQRKKFEKLVEAAKNDPNSKEARKVNRLKEQLKDIKR